MIEDLNFAPGRQSRLKLRFNILDGGRREEWNDYSFTDVEIKIGKSSEFLEDFGQILNGQSYAEI